MLRYNLNVTVYRKNEKNNQRELDFPWTAQDSEAFSEEIKRHINGVHLVDKDGNVFVFGVGRIVENN